MTITFPGPQTVGAPDPVDIDDFLAFTQGYVVMPGSLDTTSRLLLPPNGETTFLPRGLLLTKHTLGNGDEVFRPFEAGDASADVSILTHNVNLKDVDAVAHPLLTIRVLSEGKVWEERVVGDMTAFVKEENQTLKFFKREGLHA